MSRKLFVGILVVAAVLMAAVQSWAIYVHNFSCDNCHGAGISLYSTGNANLCTHCHRTGGDTIATNDGRFGPTTYLDENDLSNALGTHDAINGGTGPTEQTSHTWAALQDEVPAAGASASSAYFSRYGASNGKVTCTKCHNPHATFVGTPGVNGAPGTNTALRVDNSDDALCLDCHTGWDVAPIDALETHPIGIGLGGASVKASISDPKVQMVNGFISCSTCHNVHWSDSNGSTTDGRGGNHGTGDGKMLVTDGRGVNADTLCQACHSYQGHGTSQVGCLDCHSGHAFNSGSPNYFILRSDITGVMNKNGGVLNQADVSGLDYTSPTSPWKNPSGTGYCEGCHDLPATHNGFTTGSKADCQGCHSHGTTSGAFGGACNSCHGFAPSTTARVGTAPETGPAIITDGVTVYSAYNEANTPHINHSDPLTNNSPNHNMACDQCHANFPTGHTTDGTGSIDFAFGLDAGTGGITPSFAGGNCSTVYCHSNGRIDVPQANRNFQVVSWANGRDTITGCTACHGNTAASMTTAGNSPAHVAHLGRYSNNCSICHDQTAVNNTTLVRTGALNTITATHADCDEDVSFDPTFNLGAGNIGTTNDYMSDFNCSAVYCHSNGKGGYPGTAPTWAATGEAGKCGACHQVSTALADPALTIVGAPFAGAHETHVEDPFGPQLSCDVCHTHTAMADADHINGAVNLKANYQITVCNPCHGATDGLDDPTDVDPDRQPVWPRATSVECLTCHTGTALADFAIITGPTAPDKNSAVSTGHNKTSGTYTVSGNAAANQVCLSCHVAGTVGHFDGVTGNDKRLQAGFDCQTCHGASGTANVKNISTHQSKTCVACHDPHGSSNIFMVRAASTDYSGTVAFTATTGADSYDEDDNGDRVPGTTAGIEANADDICATCHTLAGGTLHNNSDNSSADHNQGLDCFSCHKPHDDPGGAFAAGAGTSCDGCHGFPPVTNAHVMHAPNSRALDILGDVTLPVDRSACAHCHTGADAYTYDPSVDRASLIPGRQNHGKGETTQDQTLFDSVGYAYATDLNCTGACHNSTAADGAWNDTALNCDACHDGKKTDTATIATGSHTKHLAIAANDCDTCHGVIPTDTTHITDTTGADEITKVTGMATALPNEANVLVTTWNDSTNTCAVAECHNPSTGGSFSATWGTPNAVGCAFCHSDTNPGTGSHTAHLTTPENYSANLACTECHIDNGTNTAHRNGVKDVPLDGPIATSGTATAAGTAWNGTSCSATYCHNGGLISNSGWSDPGTATSPTWGANVLTGSAANDCNACHDAPPNPAKGHPNDSNCNSCHFNTLATNDGFTDESLHVNGVVVAEGGDKCIDCHSSLSATHAKHLNVTTTLGLKTLSGGDFGDPTWFFVYSNTGGTPSAACGQCHSDNAGTHKDGTVDLAFSSNNVNIPGGNIKLRNAAVDSYAQTTGNSVTCSSVYCHSSGQDTPSYKTTPDWFGGTFSGNKCDDCHLNDPGTGAHGVHEVGIHYLDIYDAVNKGEIAATGASGAAHGDPTTASTISCQTCHNSTVTDNFNDQNATCGACHTGGTAKGDLAIAAASTTHVNGTADITFNLTGFKSKAQVRDDITTVGALNNSWTRTNGYKTGTTSYDAGKTTSPLYNTGSNTCSNVSCHNRIPATWAAPSNNCLACHTDLP